MTAKRPGGGICPMKINIVLEKLLKKILNR